MLTKYLPTQYIDSYTPRLRSGYGLDGPGIETRWGRDFSHPCRTVLPPPTSLLYSGYRVSFQGVRRPGRGVNHPLRSSAEVKVELHLYFPSVPTLGRSLPLLPLGSDPKNMDAACTMQVLTKNSHRGKTQIHGDGTLPETARTQARTFRISIRSVTATPASFVHAHYQ